MVFLVRPLMIMLAKAGRVNFSVRVMTSLVSIGSALVFIGNMASGSTEVLKTGILFVIS